MQRVFRLLYSWSWLLSDFLFSVSHRNLLYILPGKTPQFSVLSFPQEPLLGCSETNKVQKHILCGKAVNRSLSLLLRAVQSADRLMCAGLTLFENE